MKKLKGSYKDSFLNDITLGDCIRMKREKLGISQEDLAKKIYVSKTTLSNIENGKMKYPKAVYLFRISKELDINYELLLELKGFDITYIKFMDRFGSR